MTLMEAVVALVLLSLAAIGCLELSQSASRLEFNATQWNTAITTAESVMNQTTLGAPISEAGNASGATVTREQWRDGVELVTVRVPVVEGKTFELRKLIPARKAVSRVSAR